VTADVDAHLVDRAVVSLRSLLGLIGSPPQDRSTTGRTSLWSAAIQRRPAVVARCLSTPDVQATVRTAREYGLPLSVRATGHDWAGRAVRDGGLVIDVSGMRDITH
jgi:FAD/FMN-containing dehydrogenase